MVWLTIAQVAGNAFIELLERHPKKPRSISLPVLMAYCTEVQAILREQGIRSYSTFHRDGWDDLAIRKHFSFDGPKNEPRATIILRENYNAKELRREFREYLSLEVLKAFTCDRAVEVLGINKALDI